MTYKAPLTPRKLPRQERARATVEAILVASYRLIERTGTPDLKIADVVHVSGVAAGSIYQYFPGVQSILSELYLDLRRAELDVIRDALLTASDPHANAVIDAVFQFHEQRLTVHAILLDWAEAVGASRREGDVDEAIRGLFEEWLGEGSADVRERSDAAVQVLRALVDAAVRAKDLNESRRNIAVRTLHHTWRRTE